MGPEAAKSFAGRTTRPPERPSRPARHAGDRLARAARQRLHLRRLPVAFQPATGRRSPDRDAPHHRQRRRLPRAGRDLDRSGDRARLCHPRQLERASRHRCALLRPGPSALGVRLPAQVCRLSQPDRAVVEDPALTGPQRPTLRDVGGDRGCGQRGHGLLECASPSLRLGPTTSSPAPTPTRYRRHSHYPVNLPDAPLSCFEICDTPLMVGDLVA